MESFPLDSYFFRPKDIFINLFNFSSYGHMIDNVVLIVTGTLHERDVQELLDKCHPLGMFDRYHTILVYLFRLSSF